VFWIESKFARTPAERVIFDDISKPFWFAVLALERAPIFGVGVGLAQNLSQGM
jgi:hypothetical protein